MRVRRCAYVSVCVFLQCASAIAASGLIDYPAARRDESVVDDYHGTKIKDPYRWLEDPDSNETKQFIEAENNITRPYIDATPEKANIQERLEELWKFPKYLCPERHGDRYIFYLKDGLQSHHVLYIQDSLEGEPRVFLDPNTLSEDGTVSLGLTEFSSDGSLVAYGLSGSGSDWVTLHFKDVETGEDYPDRLEKIKFSDVTWTKDNKGVFYSAFLDQKGKADGSDTELNKNQKLYYHKLNTSQAEDIVVAEFPDQPLWRMTARVTDGGQYLVISVVKDYRENLLFFADLSQHPEISGKLPLTQIVHKFEAEYEYITTEGSTSIFRSNKNAPNYLLIAIDMNNPTEKNWKTLVPENPKDVLSFASAANKDKLVLHYSRDVKSVLQLHELKTGAFLQDIKLDVGTVAQLTGKKDDPEIFFYFWSFLTPGIIYHIDFTGNQPYEPKVIKETILKGFNASLYETKQIFYSSKDGTKIPMFIISKKDLPRDGSNPALLYGYGGFNINIEPGFGIPQIVFMQNLRGVYAVANIRGGGEYGDRWYNGGRLLNKQNVFDDFQAAAEYLIAENYTRPELLTIQGGSNGGLLVAACINQRPELFGAAIVQSAVLDMLRFQKFTIGYAWVSDYGSPDNKTHFGNIIKYSPLHNIQPPSNERAQYPATLVMTADHDDRVVPLHSLKFIAALQHAVRGSAQARPLLVRVDTKAGHGAGKPTAKVIEEETDILCFITQSLGLRFIK